MPLCDERVLHYCKHRPYLPLEGADVIQPSQRGRGGTKVTSLTAWNCTALHCPARRHHLWGASGKATHVWVTGRAALLLLSVFTVIQEQQLPFLPSLLLYTTYQVQLILALLQPIYSPLKGFSSVLDLCCHYTRASITVKFLLFYIHKVFSLSSAYVIRAKYATPKRI